jgi:hypothetical protein
LRLLAGNGAAEDENGHDVRLTSLFPTTFHRAQSCSSSRWFSPDGYGAMNRIAESKVHLSDEQHAANLFAAAVRKLCLTTVVAAQRESIL